MRHTGNAPFIAIYPARLRHSTLEETYARPDTFRPLVNLLTAVVSCLVALLFCAVLGAETAKVAGGTRLFGAASGGAVGLLMLLAWVGLAYATAAEERAREQMDADEGDAATIRGLLL